AIGRASKPFTDSGTALRANIEGLISTISVPYTLATKSASDRHWQAIHSAERIRSLMLDAGANERERQALTSAKSRMQSFVRSPEGRDALMRDTLNFLESLRSDEAVLRAAKALIL